MNSVPWYRSKGFWTLTVGSVLGLLVFFGVLAPTTDTVALTASVLFVLSNVFHWNSEGPLSRTKDRAKLREVSAKPQGGIFRDRF